MHTYLIKAPFSLALGKAVFLHSGGGRFRSMVLGPLMPIRLPYGFGRPVEALPSTGYITKRFIGQADRARDADLSQNE